MGYLKINRIYILLLYELNKFNYNNNIFSTYLSFDIQIIFDKLI
jgi:hypothetical protein